MIFLRLKKLQLIFALVLLSAAAVLLFRYVVPANSRVRLASRTTLDGLPKTILWAWERPEKLNFIDSSKLGVAFLAKTINLHDDTISVRPRLQPLTLPQDVSLIAIVRIEPSGLAAATLSPNQVQLTANEVIEVETLPRISAIQIDFDARVSERDFYRHLLFKVREQLPPSMPLSITALASWCVGDQWLSDLPVDEVVPMFFRLGIDRNSFVSRLQSDEQSLPAPCNQTAGVSTDEPVPPPQQKRLYIFSPKPWTASSIETALETYRR